MEHRIVDSGMDVIIDVEMYQKKSQNGDRRRPEVDQTGATQGATMGRGLHEENWL